MRVAGRWRRWASTSTWPGPAYTWRYLFPASLGGADLRDPAAGLHGADRLHQLQLEQPAHLRARHPVPARADRRPGAGQRYRLHSSTPRAAIRLRSRSRRPRRRRARPTAARPPGSSGQPARLVTPELDPTRVPGEVEVKPLSDDVKLGGHAHPARRHQAAPCARAPEGEVPGRCTGHHGIAARVRAAAAGLPQGRATARSSTRRPARSSPPTSRAASTRPRRASGCSRGSRWTSARQLRPRVHRLGLPRAASGIFVWTVIFAALTVVFTLVVGMHPGGGAQLGGAAAPHRLPDAAVPALRGARLHLDPGVQGAVQPELRRDQPDPRTACSASGRPGSPTRSWPSA